MVEAIYIARVPETRHLGDGDAKRTNSGSVLSCRSHGSVDVTDAPKLSDEEEAGL